MVRMREICWAACFFAFGCAVDLDFLAVTGTMRGVLTKRMKFIVVSWFGK